MTDTLTSTDSRWRLVIQNDGNLVIYASNGTPVWDSGIPTCTPPEPPPVESLPRLIPEGAFLIQDGGARFTAIECSDFNLFARFQRGENIEPQLMQRASADFNMLRVWTLFDLAAANIGVLLDPDYARIPDFVRACARHGLYVEFTAFTSTERPEHWDNLVAACRTFPKGAVLLELVNEGDLPVNAIDFSRYTRPSDVLCSRGSASSTTVPPSPWWDYSNWHTNGTGEEQRKVGHNAMEKFQEAGWNSPVITNETSRYRDVGMWARSDATRCANLAFDSAAGAALLCAGACFHSAAGKASIVWDDPTLAVAQAWASGALSVPLWCQREGYTRRDDLLTPDLLRVYQRGTTDAGIVRIRK